MVGCLFLFVQCRTGNLPLSHAEYMLVLAAVHSALLQVITINQTVVNSQWVFYSLLTVEMTLC